MVGAVGDVFHDVAEAERADAEPDDDGADEQPDVGNLVGEERLDAG